MILQNFIKGVLILQKYYTGGDGYHLGAEHDEIYLYSTSFPVSQEDVSRLIDLGWFQSGNGADSDNPMSYDPDEGWMCFV